MKVDSIEDMKRKYIDKNELAKKFLGEKKGNQCFSYKSLRAFHDEYEKRDGNSKKIGSAAFSERVFSYWTMKNLGKDRNYPEVDTQHRREIRLRDRKNNKAFVLKKFDFFFKSKKNKQVFIEFKCNIDNIEKDLYKFLLLKKDKSAENAVKAIVVWEGTDHWYGRIKKNSKEFSNYTKLLKDAKERKLLDEHFYFPIEDRQRAKEEIEKYIHFLKNI